MVGRGKVQDCTGCNVPIPDPVNLNPRFQDLGIPTAQSAKDEEEGEVGVGSTQWRETHYILDSGNNLQQFIQRTMGWAQRRAKPVGAIGRFLPTRHADLPYLYASGITIKPVKFTDKRAGQVGTGF